jgi:hypothetical protein
MLFPVYIVTGLLFWGFYSWGLADKASYGYVQIAIFCVYLMIILIGVYFGSAERKNIEREYILQKIEEQKRNKEIKRQEQEKYREFLKKYQKKRTESNIIKS